MILSVLLKKLKKAFRRKTRWLTLASVLTFFMVTAVQQYERAQLDREEAVPVIKMHEQHQEEPFDESWVEYHDNTYFGIDENGHLSLFEGDPGSNQILRTFFQLDIEYLESSLPQETVEQLYVGIRVKDLEEYNSVLSTLSPFAVEASGTNVSP